MGMNVRNVTDLGNLTPVGAHESIAVSAAAKAITEVEKATHYTYTVSGGPLRMRLDGDDPTTDIGLYLGVGAAGTLSKAAALQARFIKQAATDGQVDVQAMAY